MSNLLVALNNEMVVTVECDTWEIDTVDVESRSLACWKGSVIVGWFDLSQVSYFISVVDHE